MPGNPETGVCGSGVGRAVLSADEEVMTADDEAFHEGLLV